MPPAWQAVGSTKELWESCATSLWLKTVAVVFFPSLLLGPSTLARTQRTDSHLQVALSNIKLA